MDNFQITLAHPYSSVSVAGSISPSYIDLRYTGMPADLVASGAVEPHMIELAAVAGGHPRVDSRGNYFIRAERTRGRMCITRHITDIAFARQLPGVPAGIRCELIEWLDSHPGMIWVDDNDSFQDLYKHTLAGTVQALTETGFDPAWFVGKSGKFGVAWPQRTIRDSGGHYDPKIHKLMGGYFRVEQWFKKIQCPPAPVIEKRLPKLRLAWSNPAL
jgi:hypothetical protein